MRILFTGTDDDGQSRALLIIVCLLFFSLPPCLAVALVNGGESTSPLLFFLYFSPLPSFCSLLGCIISSIVLNSLSQRHDNLYLSSQANGGFCPCRVEACQSRGGANCTFPFRFITVSAVRSLGVYKLHHRITALTVEQKGQPINIIPSGLVFKV
jgi:hypothetical protein